MIEKFKSIFRPIKKQILARFGLGFLSLFLAILILIIAKDFILSLPCWLLFAYMAITAGIMLFNSIKGDIVAVTGYCVKIEQTKLCKQVKAVFIQTEKGQLKVPIRKKIHRLNEGDTVTVFMPSITRIYVQDNYLVILGYYAIDISRQNNQSSAQ